MDNKCDNNCVDKCCATVWKSVMCLESDYAVLCDPDKECVFQDSECGLKLGHLMQRRTKGYLRKTADWSKVVV